MMEKMEFTLECKGHFKTRILGLFVAGIFAVGILFPAEAVCKDIIQKSGETETVTPGGFVLDEPERKDPFVAGLLSWAWPGLGQFYVQEYAKGSFFLLADLAQKGLMYYMLFYYSDKYSTKKDNIAKWQNMENGDKTFIIMYVFSVLFLRVACAINAVNSAEAYNKEIYFPYWKSQHKLSFIFDVKPNSFIIGITQSL